MHLLLSYALYRDDDLHDVLSVFPERPTVFADSGGFTMANSGTPVALEEYANWLSRWGDVIDMYANLDVIGDPEGTWRNQVRMEELGLRPLPVFHAGAPWEYLDRYLDGSRPYVCLGGMVGSGSSTATLRWTVECHRRARDAGVVLHGFGQTDRNICRNVPFYSMDSTTWGYGHRYGWLMLWDDTRGEMLSARVGTRDVHTYGRLVRAMGLDPSELSVPGYGRVGADRSPERRAQARREWQAVARANAAAFLRFGAWLRRRWGAIEGPIGDGPFMFLADGSNDVLKVLATVDDAERTC